MSEAERSELLVRRAEHSDLAAVARLHAENFSEPWSADYWSQQLSAAAKFEATSTLFYISHKAVDPAGAPVTGVLLARRIADEAEILTIAVGNPYKRQGIARALLYRLIVDLRRDLPCRLFLEVSVQNVAALALYANHGFAEVGTRKEYYREVGKTPVDAKVLALELRN